MLKKIVKNALLLGAVGVILGLASPMLASLAISFGLAPAMAATLSTTSPIWSGIFFAAFGAVNATVTPIMDVLFGDSAKTAARTSEQMNAKGAPVVSISHGMAPGHAADLAQEKTETTKFRDHVGSPRDAAASFREKAEALPQESTARAL